MADLEGIRALIDEWGARLEGRLDALDDGHKEIRTILTGGSEPSKGVAVRLDRLEQSEEHRKWWQRAVVGAVIVSLAAWLKAAWAAIAVADKVGPHGQ